MKCSIGSTIPCQYHCVDVPEQSGTERSFEQLERTKVRNEKGQKSRLKHSLLISSGRRPERHLSKDPRSQANLQHTHSLNDTVLIKANQTVSPPQYIGKSYPIPSPLECFLI